MRYGNMQHRADERAYIIRTRLPDGSTARILAVSRDGYGAVRRVQDRYPGRTVIGCYLPDSPELAAYNAADGIR